MTTRQSTRQRSRTRVSQGSAQPTTLRTRPISNIVVRAHPSALYTKTDRLSSTHVLSITTPTIS